VDQDESRELQAAQQEAAARSAAPAEKAAAEKGEGAALTQRDLMMGAMGYQMGQGSGQGAHPQESPQVVYAQHPETLSDLPDPTPVEGGAGDRPGWVLPVVLLAVLVLIIIIVVVVVKRHKRNGGGGFRGILRGPGLA